MSAVHTTLTLPYEPGTDTRTVVDFIVNNLSMDSLWLVVRDLILSGLVAIEEKDLSELRNSLQVAYSLAEPSTMLRGRFEISPTNALPESAAAGVSMYIEQREQATKVIEEFHQVKTRFVPRYAGRYVAFYRGDVVDSDTDRMALARRFYEKYGNVPVCIARVSEEKETIQISTPLFPGK